MLLLRRPKPLLGGHPSDPDPSGSFCGGEKSDEVTTMPMTYKRFLEFT